jgi:drug/metabolite transporter (DMT)-like permease
LVVEGIKRIGSDNAAIVGSIGPVSTLLLAYFFLQENISLFQIIGTILILFGVLLVSGQKRKELI